MKKSLLALAVLGAFAGAASAQSSVTLYGTIDLSAKYVKNEGSDRRLSLSQDGINSSQLGFKGVEDLGGGLKASFVLLAGVNADTGTTNGKFFNRRSTVSLSGGFGEIRLGRDYVPTFWNDTIFDAFGTNGLGDSSTIRQINQPTPASPAVGNYARADNSIGYFLPSNLGGLYGQLMAAAGEGQATNLGRYVGGRIGFAAGPFDVAVVAAQQRNALTFAAQKTYGVGGSYDLGFVKLLGYFDRDTIDDLDLRENRYSVSAVVPLGQGEIHVGYDRSKLTGTGDGNTISKYAVGYVYNLSKRTALYTNAARLNNGDGTSISGNTLGSNNSISSGSSQTANPIAGGNSTGVEFGVRHFF